MRPLASSDAGFFSLSGVASQRLQKMPKEIGATPSVEPITECDAIVGLFMQELVLAGLAPGLPFRTPSVIVVRQGSKQQSKCELKFALSNASRFLSFQEKKCH
jgi:hypothetical protein